MNPRTYLETKSKKGHGDSESHENRVADRLKGRVVPRSGAGRTPVRAIRALGQEAGGKGDVSTDMQLIEGKTTGKGSFSVKRAHLIKITREARNVMKSPAMAYGFEVMPPDVDRDWILVPVGVWEKMLERLDAAKRVPPDSGGA